MKRVLLFGILLGAVILAALVSRRIGPHLDGEGLFEWLATLKQARWPVLLFFLLFGATSLLAPAFVFFVLAGALWGFWPGFLLGWLAANGWSHLHFFIGRTLGGRRIERWLGDSRLAFLRRELTTAGAGTMMIARQLPLPFVGVNLAAGASPLPYAPWSLGNAVGLVPAAAVYAWSAASLMLGATQAKSEVVVRLAAAAAGIVGLALVSRLAQRRSSAPGVEVEVEVEGPTVPR